jgi:MFS family permease
MDGFDRALIRARQQDLIREARRERLNRSPWVLFGLPRGPWLVAAGIFINYLGYGAVLPFEVIYLHDGRGFSLALAGIVVSLITGVAVASAALAGPAIDRFGARIVAAAAAVGLAGGYTGLAFARSAAAAVVAAVVAGIGNGALNPSQATLVATLTPPRLRHRASAVGRLGANVGVGIGGAVGGLAAAHGVAGLVILLLANAATYLIFIAILLAIVPDAAQAPSQRTGYRAVLRDRALVGLAGVNVAVIAVGWGAFTWLVPPYARDRLAVSAPLIGVMFLANAVTVAVAQLPIARLAEGHGRGRTMALGAAAFAVAMLFVLGAGAWPTYPALVVAAILVGLGECLHTTVLMPLAADLAPPDLRGRYMAVIGLSWWFGLALAPALGTAFLNNSPQFVFLACAAVAFGGAGLAIGLERRLPATARLTPETSPSRG